MKVENNQPQRIAANEQTRVNAPQEIQRQVLRETTIGNNSTQKQMTALMANAPQQNVQKTAQAQIQKGYLDIKI